MQSLRTQLLVALAAIVAGVLAFFVFLHLVGVDGDTVPLGLREWVVAGLLVGPGFGLLIRWRAARDARRRP